MKFKISLLSAMIILSNLLLPINAEDIQGVYYSLNSSGTDFEYIELKEKDNEQERIDIYLLNENKETKFSIYKMNIFNKEKPNKNNMPSEYLIYKNDDNNRPYISIEKTSSKDFEFKKWYKVETIKLN